MKKFTPNAATSVLAAATLCVTFLMSSTAAEHSRVTTDAAKSLGSFMQSQSSHTQKSVDSFQEAYSKAQKAEYNLPIDQKDFNLLVRQGVSSQALRLALKAYRWAVTQGEVSNKRYLTIVDFSRPSTERRLHVIDLVNHKIVFNELVSQGAGSGKGAMATYFSDVNNSHASVLGALVTEETYSGKHGYSLRLNGLENINKNVESRAIVMHSANYATASFASMNNRLGNSWGCFAMDPAVSTQVINTIKGGSVIFAYAPQINNDANYA